MTSILSDLISPTGGGFGTIPSIPTLPTSTFGTDPPLPQTIGGINGLLNSNFTATPTNDPVGQLLISPNFYQTLNQLFNDPNRVNALVDRFRNNPSQGIPSLSGVATATPTLASTLQTGNGILPTTGSGLTVPITRSTLGTGSNVLGTGSNFSGLTGLLGNNNNGLPSPTAFIAQQLPLARAQAAAKFAPQLLQQQQPSGLGVITQLLSVIVKLVEKLIDKKDDKALTEATGSQQSATTSKNGTTATPVTQAKKITPASTVLPRGAAANTKAVTNGTTTTQN